jgi:hypothetical protein
MPLMAGLPMSSGASSKFTAAYKQGIRDAAAGSKALRSAGTAPMGD